MRYVGCGLIGAGVGVLQPDQPRSAIAAFLLIVGLDLWHAGKGRAS